MCDTSNEKHKLTLNANQTSPGMHAKGRRHGPHFRSGVGVGKCEALPMTAGAAAICPMSGEIADGVFAVIAGEPPRRSVVDSEAGALKDPGGLYLPPWKI